jgi:hypothetical protein
VFGGLFLFSAELDSAELKGYNSYMRESIFIPEHRTNVLPLRWLANGVFHRISMVFLHIGLKANYKIYESNEGYTIRDEIKESLGAKLYKLFDIPYTKWGTVYRMDIDLANKIMSETLDAAWDDHDEDGNPYWHFDWHIDPITKDAWRILPKTKN